MFYKIILSIFLAIHTYLLLPKIYLLYRFSDSRIGPYSPKNDVIYFWPEILIIFLSYLLIFLVIKSIFKLKDSIKYIFVLVIAITIILIYLFNIYHPLNFYQTEGIFINTFSTQGQVIWGPFEKGIQTEEPDRLDIYGSLKIGTYYPPDYKRLSLVFSDINKNDWIQTYYALSDRSSIWESEPEFKKEEHIKRLEDFDKKYLNTLFNREIENGTIERLFNGKDSLNALFMEYILSDSITSEHEITNKIYSLIDSLN